MSVKDCIIEACICAVKNYFIDQLDQLDASDEHYMDSLETILAYNADICHRLDELNEEKKTNE